MKHYPTILFEYPPDAWDRYVFEVAYCNEGPGSCEIKEVTAVRRKHWCNLDRQWEPKEITTAQRAMAEAWLWDRIEHEQDLADDICVDCVQDWSERKDKSGPGECRPDDWCEDRRSA